RVVDPVQDLWRPVGGTEVQPDGMPLLLAPLELKQVGELRREESQPEHPAAVPDGPGELLPEFGDGRRDAIHRGFQSEDGPGPEAGLFLTTGTDAVATERTRHHPVAVDMVAALPVVAAAGVLVDVDAAICRGLPGLAAFRPVPGPAVRSVLEGQFQAHIAEKQ